MESHSTSQVTWDLCKTVPIRKTRQSWTMWQKERKGLGGWGDGAQEGHNPSALHHYHPWPTSLLTALPAGLLTLYVNAFSHFRAPAFSSFQLPPTRCLPVAFLASLVFCSLWLTSCSCSCWLPHDLNISYSKFWWGRRCRGPVHHFRASLVLVPGPIQVQAAVEGEGCPADEALVLRAASL